MGLPAPVCHKLERKGRYGQREKDAAKKVFALGLERKENMVRKERIARKGKRGKDGGFWRP